MRELVIASKDDITARKGASKGIGFAMMAGMLRELGYGNGIDVFENAFNLGPPNERITQ